MSARDRCSVALARVAPYVAYVPLLEFDALADSCKGLAPLVPPGLPLYAVRAVAAITLRPRIMQNSSNETASVQVQLYRLYEKRKLTLDRLLVALTLRIDPAHEAALLLASAYTREEMAQALGHTDEFVDLALAFQFLEEMQPAGGDETQPITVTGAVESVVHMWLTRSAINMSVGKKANVYAKRRALLTYDPLRVQVDVAALSYKCATATKESLQQLKHAINALNGGDK